MKKILFVHHASIIGGGTLSAADLISMINDEFEVKVLISTTTKETKKFFYDKGFDCIEYEDNMGTLPWYNGGPRIYSRTFWYCIYKMIKFKKVFEKILYEKKPDVVILNSIILSWLGPMLKKKNIKAICFVRETRKKGMMAKIQEYFLSKFDSICFISEYDKNQYNLKKNKRYIVRDCVKEEIFKEKSNIEFNINYKMFNILYLGGENTLKGWNTLKKILINSEKSRYEGIEFLILGEVSDKEKINKKNIRYFGCRENVNEMMKYSDVLILPSSKAHQLRPIIEGGFAECPIIVSDFKEIKENIKENVTCLTIEPNNHVDLEEKIFILKNNRELSEKLIKNNSVFVKEKYEYKSIKKIFTKIIKNI